MARSCSAALLLAATVAGAPPAPAPPPDGFGTVLAPAPGTARPDALADGWPVWVVGHGDGTSSVISAVAPLRLRDDLAGAQLVTWIAEARRFLVGSLVYDEHGVVLGHSAFLRCEDFRCPDIGDMTPTGRDLDRYAVDVSDGGIRVGALVPGGSRDLARSWVGWGDREASATDVVWLPSPSWPGVALGDVARGAVGPYAVVTGRVVRTSDEPTRLCGPSANMCDPCTEPALPLAAARQSGDARTRTAVDGIFLLRRSADGLEILAASVVGECGILIGG